MRFFARFIGHKVGKTLYTETMIALYEKQMAARDAMGVFWIGHPLNAVARRTDRAGEISYEIGIPSGPPMLRIVK
jgi:hypothetical protein